ALGQVGESKPSAAIAALGKAIKDPDPQLRQAAVAGLCAVGRRSAGQVASALKAALHDADSGVRQRVAACVRDEPAVGARLAPALAGDADAAVRAAAAAAIGASGKNADGSALATLVG